eukprot:354028-Chlamydomonas_euryale.AAC.13
MDISAEPSTNDFRKGKHKFHPGAATIKNAVDMPVPPFPRLRNNACAPARGHTHRMRNATPVPAPPSALPPPRRAAEADSAAAWVQAQEGRGGQLQRGRGGLQKGKGVGRTTLELRYCWYALLRGTGQISTERPRLRRVSCGQIDEGVGKGTCDACLIRLDGQGSLRGNAEVDGGRRVKGAWQLGQASNWSCSCWVALLCDFAQPCCVTLHGLAV